jgi:hypothetical protein
MTIGPTKCAHYRTITTMSIKIRTVAESLPDLKQVARTIVKLALSRARAHKIIWYITLKNIY